MAESETAVEEKKPNGLGGWLILPAIGILLAPLRMLGNAYALIPEAGVWEQITTPGTELYHSLLGPLMIFEAIGNVAILIASLVLVVLFFTKSRHLPRLIIIVMLAGVLFQFAVQTVAEYIPATASSGDITEFKGLVQSIFACLIWVPYFLVSVRVKNTFVN